MATVSRRISSFSVILTFVFFTIVGLSLIGRLPVKLAPSQSLPQINVSFSMYGSSPIVIEMEVTSRLEAMLSRMKGVKKISSSSGNGWGNIILELDRHVNPDHARFEASTIIRQAWPQLPQGLSYPDIQLRSSDDNARKTFLSYSVVATASPVLIQQFAEERIKTHLAQIDGVYQVNVSGANPMEWMLEYDVKELEQTGLSLADIKTSVNQYLKNESLGVAMIVDNETQERYIRVALVSDIDPDKDVEAALNQICIKNTHDKIIHLSDIVSINKIESQPSGYYRINGFNTIYLSIVADEYVNQLELGTKVKAKLAELQAAFPAGFQLNQAYDATEYIREELNKIYFRSGLTILILLLFVILVYRKLKYTLLIIISLVINIAVSLIFYYLFHVEIQLYSLAGITISLTLIIDNVIVLSDQIIHRGNRKAFLAILAATLTTMGSLVIIFFLEEKIRLNLKDFAVVIIINLSVSLAVALFLVPALIDKLKATNSTRSQSTGFKTPILRIILTFFKSKRILVYFNRFYFAQSRFLRKKRLFVFAFAILLFGLPVFMLPDKIEKEGGFATIYNSTIGSEFYKEYLKTPINYALGGTWRLFVQKVYNGSYFNNNREETSLFVTATLPNGATLEQMNFLIQCMETYLNQFAEVRQFETSIMNPNRASITIRFTKEHQKSGFPHQLKSKLISKSLELGGGSWSVYGVGDGFSNDIKENAGSYRAELFGYNYDELYGFAEKFRSKLLEYRRIKEVLINSEFSWYKEDYQEYKFQLNHERLAKAGIEPYQLYASLKPYFERNSYVALITNTALPEKIMAQSLQSKQYDVWNLQHLPIVLNEKEFKLSELATIEKYQTPQQIAKENQQYKLCVQYEYIGAYEQGHKVLESGVKAFQNELPIGYSIVNNAERNWSWGTEDSKQYWLIGIVFIIIFFSAGILFNSIKQALYIVFIIPISFIGIFLTFYWFNLNFDSGGFAAFILLSGLTVNANIFIIDEFNNIRRDKKISHGKAYVKAWNAKIRPLFLTIVSTILGFIPFIVGYKEAFWFPLAAGTIGGLIMSFVCVFFVLPVFLFEKDNDIKKLR